MSIGVRQSIAKPALHRRNAELAVGTPSAVSVPATLPPPGNSEERPADTASSDVRGALRPLSAVYEHRISSIPGS
jgi:hypothetical protein